MKDKDKPKKPPKNSKEILKELCKENPNILTLIKKLDLEIVQ